MNLRTVHETYIRIYLKRRRSFCDFHHTPTPYPSHWYPPNPLWHRNTTPCPRRNNKNRYNDRVPRTALLSSKCLEQSMFLMWVLFRHDHQNIWRTKKLFEIPNRNVKRPSLYGTTVSLSFPSTSRSATDLCTISSSYHLHRSPDEESEESESSHSRSQTRPWRTHWQLDASSWDPIA